MAELQSSEKVETEKAGQVDSHWLFPLAHYLWGRQVDSGKLVVETPNEEQDLLYCKNNKESWDG